MTVRNWEKKSSEFLLKLLPILQVSPKKMMLPPWSHFFMYLLFLQCWGSNPWSCALARRVLLVATSLVAALPFSNTAFPCTLLCREPTNKNRNLAFFWGGGVWPFHVPFLFDSFPVHITYRERGHKSYMFCPGNFHKVNTPMNPSPGSSGRI